MKWNLIGWRSGEVNVAPPRVEVGGVGLDVGDVMVSRRRRLVRVEDELVWREEQVAKETLDALGTRRVVTRRQEGAAAAPRAAVRHVERKVLRQFRRTVVTFPYSIVIIHYYYYYIIFMKAFPCVFSHFRMLRAEVIKLH